VSLSIVTINEKTVKGKSLLQFLKTNFNNENFISFDDDRKPNKELVESYEDAFNERVIKYSSAKEMAKALKITAF